MNDNWAESNVTERSRKQVTYYCNHVCLLSMMGMQHILMDENIQELYCFTMEIIFIKSQSNEYVEKIYLISLNTWGTPHFIICFYCMN